MVDARTTPPGGGAVRPWGHSPVTLRPSFDPDPAFRGNKEIRAVAAAERPAPGRRGGAKSVPHGRERTVLSATYGTDPDAPRRRPVSSRSRASSPTDEATGLRRDCDATGVISQGAASPQVSIATVAARGLARGPRSRRKVTTLHASDRRAALARADGSPRAPGQRRGPWPRPPGDPRGPPPRPRSPLPPPPATGRSIPR